MFNDNSPFHRLQLPRDDIRVMLHLCDDDLIASLHLTLTERLSHQIDGLRSATRKDDFLSLRGIDKLTHFFACCLVQIRCLLREIMHPAMHIGIHIEILLAHRVEHTQRFLCRRCIIQIHQRLLIYLPRQNGKIFADLIYIVHLLFTFHYSLFTYTTCSLSTY